jgi:DNA ligase-1
MIVFTKARDWNKQDLTGEWEVTVKIDGVRAFLVDGQWISRNGKPLYNLPQQAGNGPTEGYEVYHALPGRSSKDNFWATNGTLKAKNMPERLLSTQDLYSLNPIDPRLLRPSIENPSVAMISELLEATLAAGYEGLILRQGDKWIKVKPVNTYDVTVLDCVEGIGKHKGRLGAVVTSRGNVGTGFSDEERQEWWTDFCRHTEDPQNCIGRIIEVSCMGLSAKGQFRHARFERIRTDKNETDDLHG